MEDRKRSLKASVSGGCTGDKELMRKFCNLLPEVDATQ